MSTHNLPVVLTRRAREDDRQLPLYSLREWGEGQQDSYDAALIPARTLLGDNPDIGRPRAEFGAGYRSYPVEQHFLFYRFTSTAVGVACIIHKRADVQRAARGRP